MNALATLHWLAWHGVAAEQGVLPAIGDDADALRALAYNLGADRIVAGTYGHSRLREWFWAALTTNLS